MLPSYQLPKIIACLFLLIFCQKNLLFSQTHVYTINADVPAQPVDSTHLHMGGSNAKGDTISVNNFYISYNHKPFISVTGEFHFSRYPEAYWNESLQRMKAGGINTIATYVFWSLHEEHEGKFDW